MIGFLSKLLRVIDVPTNSVVGSILNSALHYPCHVFTLYARTGRRDNYLNQTNASGYTRSGDPDPKSCSIKKQNSGMINTPLNGGGADEKVTIHRRADCLCSQAGRAGDVRAGCLP
ncbi:hypothetical protein CBW57_21045 [Yersinia intermedia]|uniref:Uncharacterized protein n=1 Tax=Yersinia intermedia TaxID=631 RepID=A0A208ZMK9_YERIN|nr:hypothetical protein CBW57_21045 [Yersinia intermedia]